MPAYPENVRSKGVDQKSPWFGQRDAFDPSPALALWHPGYEHTLTEALARGKEGRMVARRIGAVAADGEGWIERQPCLCGGPRLIQFTEQCKGGSEEEVRKRVITVCFDAAT